MPDPTSSRRLLARGLAAAALLLATVGLAAARQTTRPIPDGDRPSRDNRDNRDGHDGDRRDRPPRAERPDHADRPEWREPTDAEWEQTLGFLREHSPRRLELYKEYAAHWQPTTDAATDATTAPADGGDAASRPASQPSPRSRARSRIFARVESMRDLQTGDASLYEFVLNQFRLEDAAIGGLLDARAARQRDDRSAEQAADAAVDAAVRQYVENAFAERQARIDRLRQDLAEEEQHLSDDRGRMDDMMQHLRSRYERYVPDDATADDKPGDPPRRRRGPQKAEPQ